MNITACTASHKRYVEVLTLGTFEGDHIWNQGLCGCKRCCCCSVALVMWDSVWSHSRQPTRLLCPWDSPGKKTGVGCHFLLQCMKAKSESEDAQSCPILCNPIDSSPLGSSVPGIPQARPLEWVAISFSNAWKWKVKVKSLSHAWLFETPWTAAYQAPPSMGFSRQEQSYFLGRRH